VCDLLAMSFNKPVTATFSLKGFRVRGRYNSDGWGVAWYPDKSVQVVKEPAKATKSKLFSDSIEDIEMVSEIFIGHVRRLSAGERAYRNTHPFWRELNGKAYVFAHNGSSKNKCKERFSLGRFKPLGETDSEHLFCHILRCIEEQGIESWSEEDFRWLSEKFLEINKCYTFNCAMSDGDHLFVYHDSGGHNGMALVYREAPFKKIGSRLGLGTEGVKNLCWSASLF